MAFPPAKPDSENPATDNKKPPFVPFKKKAPKNLQAAAQAMMAAKKR